MERYQKKEIEQIFDNLLLFSEKALTHKEVPIVASFITTPKDTCITKSDQNFLKFEHLETQHNKYLLLEKHHNLTNTLDNATKHCEILGIDNIQKHNSTSSPLISFKSRQ